MHWIYILIIDIILLIPIFKKMINYQFYISSITISLTDMSIVIELFKGNKLRKKFEYLINDIAVKIVDHPFYWHPLYELRIYYKGYIIANQRETMNWELETFKEIKKLLFEIKSTKMS